ncbi:MULTISPECIES: hypothetical protein [Bacillus]|uniref:hypothetical protein n=1 Tax=Bacillus TaxID=1386 RepID=UPI0003122C7D|nr:MULTISPECIES: hypothetical protein [Bacillus]
MGEFISVMFRILSAVGLLILVLGICSKDWKGLIISGFCLLLPSLYFLGGENWFKLLVLFPLIPFLFAYYINKKADHRSR